MKRNEPISHIMSKSPITVHTHSKPSEVRAILQDGEFHHLPVVNGKKLVGMISTADLLRMSFGGEMNGDSRSWDAVMDHTHTAESLMRKDVVSLSSSGSVRDAAGMLVEGNFHALPVVENGDLVGIVTSTDLIRYLLDQY